MCTSLCPIHKQNIKRARVRAERAAESTCGERWGVGAMFAFINSLYYYTNLYVLLAFLIGTCDSRVCDLLTQLITSTGQMVVTATGGTA